MASLESNLKMVRETIARSAEKAGRDASEVKLLCVTKTVGIAEIQQLYRLGERRIGESRVQSAGKKIAQIPSLGVEWHLIGHLQTNKVKHSLDLFQMIHSVDSLHLAEAISKRATMLEIVFPILIEVNVSGEASKYGVPLETLQPETEGQEPVWGLVDLTARIARLPGLEMRGLMTMAPFDADAEAVRPVFRKLRQLRDELNQRGLTPQPLVELSMGMTNDYPVAVEEGATYVRIGSALFA